MKQHVFDTQAARISGFLERRLRNPPQVAGDNPEVVTSGEAPALSGLSPGMRALQASSESRSRLICRRSLLSVQLSKIG